MILELHTVQKLLYLLRVLLVNGNDFVLSLVFVHSLSYLTYTIPYFSFWRKRIFLGSARLRLLPLVRTPFYAADAACRISVISSLVREQRAVSARAMPSKAMRFF